MKIYAVDLPKPLRIREYDKVCKKCGSSYNTTFKKGRFCHNCKDDKRTENILKHRLGLF